MRMRERSKFDFYKTPEECIRLVSEKINNAWEICAGDGIFKDVLGDKIIKMSDINPRRNDVENIDFFITAEEYKDEKKLLKMIKELVEKEISTSRTLEKIYYDDSKFNYYRTEIAFGNFN